MAGARWARVSRRRRAKAARVAVSRMPRGAIYRARELGPWRAGLGARGGVPRPDSGSSPRQARVQGRSRIRRGRGAAEGGKGSSA